MRTSIPCIVYIVLSSCIFHIQAGNVKISDQEPEHPLNQLFGNSHLSKFLPSNANLGADKMTLLNKRSNQSDDLIPVVIIPPLMGTKLQAKLVNRYSHWYCSSNSDWFTLFAPNLKSTFLPYVATCWIENISLDYNMTTHWATTPQGIETRFTDYGGVDSIAYMDDDHQIGVWNDTIALLVKAGYTIGKNLRGAPFDWRKSPAQYSDDYSALKKLIEDTYDANGNRSVAITSVSMGSSYMILFFNTYVTQQWKNKYIHSWTSFCPAFGGSIFAIPSLASTFNRFNVPWYILSGAQIQQMAASFGSAYWLLPFEQLYGDSIVAITPQKNYTGSEVLRIFEAIGDTKGLDMLERMKFARNLQAPGVPMNCIYGYNVSTAQQVVFSTSDLSTASTTFINGDGDGTVPIQGLSICEQWKHQQTQQIQQYAIPNMNHGLSIKRPDTLKIFLNSLGILAR